MEEVLKHALLRMPEPISWEEGAVKADSSERDEDAVGVVAH
jgi:ATP-dependent Lon protease